MNENLYTRSVCSEGMDPSYQALLSQVDIEETGDIVLINCPSTFIKNLLSSKHIDTIKRSYKKDIKIILREKALPSKSVAPNPVQMMLADTAPASSGVNPRFKFENFIVGECNSFAYQAAQAAVEDYVKYSPLYFYSDTGLGKSHISHAIGNGLIDKRKMLKARYTTAQDFSQEYVYACKNGVVEQFRKGYRTGLDLLFIDDVHMFSNKEKTQLEVSSLIDDIMSIGTQVVFAGYRPPGTIQQLDKGLRSRMSAGLMIHIKSPDILTRATIVRAKASAESIVLPDNVVEFISDTVATNIRDLESAVMTLLAMSSLMKRDINLDLAHEALEGTIRRRSRIDILYIQDTVCKNFNLERSELVSPSRKKDVAYPRQIAIYLCRQLTRDSLQTIGQAFGRKHSSVIHTLEVMDAEYRDNLKTKKEVDYILEKTESAN